MPRFRKKPVVIEVTQWFKAGDHPNVDRMYGAGTTVDTLCGHPSNAHGFIKTLEGTMTVCPGDWIITGVQGEHYPCKPDIFEQTYELVEEDDGG